MARKHDPFDAASELDDEPTYEPRGGSRRPSETKRVARSAYATSSNPPRDRGMYDELATSFRTHADCYVQQGQPLIAKLLKQRVQAEDRLVKTTLNKVARPEPLVQEMVEYMIKHFWLRVANDQRPFALNAFLGEWWDDLVEETCDHQTTIRIPDDAWKPAGGHVINDDPFYDAWDRPEKERPTGTLSERLAAAIAHKNEESN